MSIPTRLKIINIDGSCEIDSIFTISYGQNTNNPDVWKEHIQWSFDSMAKNDKEKFIPWINTFTKIIALPEERNIQFERSDFKL